MRDDGSWYKIIYRECIMFIKSYEDELNIAESRYSRIKMNEINKLLSKVKITQDING